MDEYFDVNLGEPGDACGFLGGHLFCETEPEHLELALGQNSPRACPKIFSALLMFELPCRGRLGAHEFRRCKLPLPDRAKVIQGGASGDGEQPVDDGALGIDAMNMLERLHERLLGEVFGVLPLARHLKNKVQHAAVVQMHELLERPHASTRGGPHKMCLVMRHDHRAGD